MQRAERITKGAVAMLAPIECQFQVTLRIEVPLIVPGDGSDLPDSLVRSASALARAQLLAAIGQIRDELEKQFAVAVKLAVKPRTKTV